MATTNLDFVVRNGLQVSSNAAVCGITNFYGNVIANALTNLGPAGNITVSGTGAALGNVLT